MSTEVTTKQNTQLATWQSALVKAETKFIAIADPKKAKIELGFAVQIIEQNPSLKTCDVASIQNAIINVARTGITLNPAMKLAYLIPRKGKCILDFSYMGLIHVLTDGGDVKYLTASIVYDDEEFSFDPINCKHVPVYPKTEEENKKRTIFGALSMAILKDDTRVYEFMPLHELLKIKRQSMAANSSYSPYAEWETEMYKKSVIRRHYKFLPKGNPDADKVAAAMEIENSQTAPENASIADVFDVESTDVTNQVPEGTITITTPDTKSKK